jgi:mediator of RNA polymerase II transcription subunit 13
VESPAIVEIQGHDLLMKDKGTYDPAILTRAKQNTLSSLSNLSATSMTSSPASFENHIRSGSGGDSGMRRTQTTSSSQNAMTDPPTPSPGAKTSITLEDASSCSKDIHEAFISAALGSIVYFLCHDHGFVPLNSRILILPTSNASKSDGPTSIPIPNSNTITLATLDISLTSLGALVLKAHYDTAPGLQSILNPSGPNTSLSDLSPGTTLLLAPGGTAAKFYGTKEDKNLPSHMPISQLQKSLADNRKHIFNGPTIQSWQSKCIDWLSAKGLNTAALEQGGWIFVQVLGGNSPYFKADYERIPILEDLAIVSWPALLCFQTSSNGSHDLQSFDSILTATRDPLSFAEEWFTRKDERASTLAKRQNERQIAEAKSREQADVEGRNLQSAIYSPFTLRRGSNAGAMYPTPPDAPQHPVGATPSFDCQGLTPGNPNHLFSHDVGATPQNTNNEPMDIETDIWDSSDRKELSSISMNFNDNDIDNDLFGDVGGDLFGDVTDADFNFFDEPDMEDTVQGSVGSPQATASTSQEVGFSMDAPAIVGPALGVPGMIDINMEDSKSTNRSIPPHESKQTEMQPPSSRKEKMATFQGKNDVEIEQSPVASPPFDKEAVFKRLVTKASELQPRRSSNFNKVDFESSVLSVDAKYGVNGRFRFSTGEKPHHPRVSQTLPRTDYLTRRRKTNAERGARSRARITRESEVANLEIVDSEPMLYALDSDASSQMSEQDDTSDTSEDRPPTLNPGVKRKWTENEGGNEMALSFNALAVEYEQSLGTPMSTSGSQIPLLDGDPADWSLTTYFTSPEPDVQSNALSDFEYIAAAQILADQTVSGTIKLPGPASRVSRDGHAYHSRSSGTRGLLHTVTEAAKACFKDVAACTMQSFLEIQGIPVLNQGLRVPPRPTPRGAVPDPSRSSNPFSIPPPQLEVRRSDSNLSILPSALSFWEDLGLEPAKGSKDVSAICFYPNFEGIADRASAFLDSMRSVYESFRLGTHERIVAKDLINSLVPFTVDASQQPNSIHNLVGLKQSIDTLAALKETVARLSRIISSLPLEEKNIVVYFIYPMDNATLIVHICTAFQHLFNIYRRTLSERKINSTNELVLQLVPLDFVASPTSIMVPLPSESARLAMEVYDRCINFSSDPSAPAILIEQPLPKSIDFKMTATPSAAVLQENSCLHIAYAQSIDGRWITAAWINNRGTQQMTASYCLGRKNEPVSMLFSDVANEIWETTMDIISAKKIHWRVMITRVGVMDPSEIEFWAGLQSTESEAQINLTLITVQTDPSLQLLPPCITLSPTSNAAQSVITPVSTPQAIQSSVVSPDQSQSTPQAIQSSIASPDQSQSTPQAIQSSIASPDQSQSTPQAIQSSIVSPDQSQSTPPARDAGGSAPTPLENSAELDADARLIDYTDQSWGAVLAHRLNNSNSLLELEPALISGYLIKRGGTNPEDPPIVMEVNIVYSEVVGNPRTFHEGLLREILGYYRGLGTLARVRGVVDSVKDIRPWHIAAVEKAVKALYTLM